MGWLSFILSLPLLIKSGADSAGVVIPYLSQVANWVLVGLQVVGLPTLAQSQPVIKK